MQALLDRIPKGWRGPVVALLALAVAGVGLSVDFTEDGPDGPKKRTVTIRVDTASDGDTRRDDPMVVPASAVADAEKTDVNEHDGLRDETPAGVPDEVLDEAQKQQDELAATDQLPIVTPLAAPSQRGCRTRIVGNASSRRGVRPRVVVMHYTVSPNRAGWSDVDGITAYFNNPGSSASSHYVVDRDGHCNYIVREYDKAWTQAAGNPVSISFEIINTGKEQPFMNPAGYRRVGQVIADISKRWEIPVRPGKVSGATVVRSGIVQHADFGQAGGGHHDIGPFPIGPVIQAAKAAQEAQTCSAKCQRRREHAQIHQRSKQLGCSRKTSRARHPKACERLSARNRELHKAGV